MMPFDWVTARSECSVNRFFELLREVVDSDVKKVNGLRKRGLKFSLSNEVPPEKIVVVRERDCAGLTEHMYIVFERLESKISVRRKASQSNDLLFEGIPTMNQEGECLLRAEKEELRMWQVSRNALENFFFEY